MFTARANGGAPSGPDLANEHDGVEDQQHDECGAWWHVAERWQLDREDEDVPGGDSGKRGRRRVKSSRPCGQPRQVCDGAVRVGRAPRAAVLQVEVERPARSTATGW